MNIKNPQNNNNNNNVRYNDRYNDRYNLTQLSLSGNKATQIDGLNGFQLQLLETFYENREVAISPSTLFKAWGHTIHPNTIKNFIKSASARGWIFELKRIEGTTVSNAYIHCKSPDHLSTGQIINDKRYKYYKITKIGIDLWEHHSNLKK